MQRLGPREHLRVGAAEAIDRLLGIADIKQLGLALATGLDQAIEDLGLDRADVLVLVDQHVAMPTSQVGARAWVREQLEGQLLEIVVAQQRAPTQALGPVAANPGRELDPAGELLGVVEHARGPGIGHDRALAPSPGLADHVAQVMMKVADLAHLAVRTDLPQRLDVGLDAREIRLGQVALEDPSDRLHQLGHSLGVGLALQLEHAELPDARHRRVELGQEFSPLRAHEQLARAQQILGADSTGLVTPACARWLTIVDHRP